MRQVRREKPLASRELPARSASGLANRYKKEHPDADRAAIEVSLRITDCYLAQYETMARVFQAMNGSRSDSRYGVLRALYFAEDYLTPKDIRQSIRMAPANVTYLLDDLERDGYVVRSPHPSDRRATCVRLTPEGMKLASMRVLGMVRLLTYIGGEFSEIEKQQLLDLLARFQARTETSFELDQKD